LQTNVHIQQFFILATVRNRKQTNREITGSERKREGCLIWCKQWCKYCVVL